MNKKDYNTLNVSILLIYIWLIAITISILEIFGGIKDLQKAKMCVNHLSLVPVVNTICTPPNPFLISTQEEEEFSLSKEEIELVAQVTMAEAEAEPELGQRLVIDSILNRVDAPQWPNTITDVVNQPYQYTSEDNERFHRCYPREDLVELVKEELISRTDYDVVFFRTGRYSDYGVPMNKVGHHYFSKYE